jgi:hypothetical protein
MHTPNSGEIAVPVTVATALATSCPRSSGDGNANGAGAAASCDGATHDTASTAQILIPRLITHPVTSLGTSPASTHSSDLMPASALRIKLFVNYLRIPGQGERDSGGNVKNVPGSR